MKKVISGAAAICALAIAGNATAHIGIARENVFALGDAPREYLEGSSASLGVQLPHDCKNEADEHFATTDVVVIFPNAENLSGDFMTTDRDGGIFGANAMMGIKARVSANWKKVNIEKGDVGPYYSHGVKTEGVRAIKWLRGMVDNDHYDNLEIKTKFPKINPDSCVGNLKIEVPSIQYCKSGYAIAWIGTSASELFPLLDPPNPKVRLTETFTASFKVVRDLENNPLPKNCGEPTEEVIRPSDADIDAFGSRQP
ncbi:MAG: DUF1775 domain-containing protein [Methylococcales bacterium]